REAEVAGVGVAGHGQAADGLVGHVVPVEADDDAGDLHRTHAVPACAEEVHLDLDAGGDGSGIGDVGLRAAAGEIGAPTHAAVVRGDGVGAGAVGVVDFELDGVGAGAARDHAGRRSAGG